MAPTKAAKTGATSSPRSSRGKDDDYEGLAAELNKMALKAEEEKKFRKKHEARLEELSLAESIYQHALSTTAVVAALSVLMETSKGKQQSTDAAFLLANQPGLLPRPIIEDLKKCLV